MNDLLAKALSHISEAHIQEAADAPPRRRLWLGAIAAVLALVLLFQVVGLPMGAYAKTVSTASVSRAPDMPDIDDFSSRDEWRSAYDAYCGYRDSRTAVTAEALTAMELFFHESTAAYIGDSTENQVYSPVNTFIALGMLVEVTGGESRQQILRLLGTESPDALRQQVEALWESVYTDDGHEVVTLANSLWLNEGIEYNQEAMDALAYFHYASVYQTDLGNARAGKALQEWLNENTGGLLKKQTGTAGFSPDAVLTLASTVYLQGKWVEEFSASRNTKEIFHAPGGDKTVTYMNKKRLQTNYYWGDSFGAVALGLKNHTRMWFFLPDEGKTVADVINEGQYLELLGPKEQENVKYMLVNLSVPKFDISSGSDLRFMLEDMGVTDVFDPEESDFTAITRDTPICVTAVNQAARVIVDEQGVKAASYIEIPGAGAAQPPEEIIDFILDRPFLFVIANYDGVPLFVGTVNEP